MLLTVHCLGKLGRSVTFNREKGRNIVKNRGREGRGFLMSQYSHSQEQRNDYKFQTSDLKFFSSHLPIRTHTMQPAGIAWTSLSLSLSLPCMSLPLFFLVRVKLQRAVRPKESLCPECRWVLLLVVIRRHNT